MDVLRFGHSSKATRAWFFSEPCTRMSQDRMHSPEVVEHRVDQERKKQFHMVLGRLLDFPLAVRGSELIPHCSEGDLGLEEYRLSYSSRQEDTRRRLRLIHFE